MEAVAIVPKSGIIAGGRGHDRRALAALEQASCGSSSSSSRRLPFLCAFVEEEAYSHHSWPEFVEHASSEAGRLAIVTSWANMGLASMRGRLCEEREARSEVAGHLLSKIAVLLVMCCTGHVRCTLAGKCSSEHAHVKRLSDRRY